ncbi:MAG: chorismate synthase [Methanothrix sp.]|jgi:chorismate synthase|uniref:chorismate synthase n=1 Tax=Methanothrix sp. TaxID=90426 RepID=UPI00247C7D29|nr:chorismate synthase [Methanothrix sp.]
MTGSTFGTVFRVTTWGESHGRAVGAVVDGCPAGLELSENDVQRELDRRRPGQSTATTERREADVVEILSGVFEGLTTGTPISMLVWNKDARSSHYDSIRHTPRPGHADYTYHAKYGIRDHRGGGRASARETVGRVAAGAVARKLLSEFGVEITGYVIELGGIRASLPGWTSRGSVDREELLSIRERAESSPIRCPDADASSRMLSLLESVRSDGDSIGGVVEVVAIGVPPGLGEPVFDKLDADLAKALMSIGAVKAVEIGAGFESARLRGSEMNDPILYRNGRISFERNNAGGILGGISTGAPIICRIAVKPTPSIATSQRTVDLQSGEAVDISVRGRHDPAIPPRIVPVAEAMIALVLADHLLRQRSARLR